MGDLLVALGSRPATRKLIGSLGLRLPRRLRRASGPWEARPLDGWTVVVGGVAGGALAPVIAKTVAAGGASTATSADGLRPEALIFDASALDDPAGLRALYDFFHPLVRLLATCGRAVVLGRPPSGAGSAAAAAARGALEGFVRSLAKEVGRSGATAQLLLVEPGAEARVEPALRFLLSARAAFVSGQVIAIDTRVPAPAQAPPTRPLEKKVALVTGAARGIGQVTARRLAEEGAHVVCLDRPADEAAAAETARAVDGSLLAVDVADGGAPGAIARHIADRHGGVDVVVHNAGVTRDKTLGRMSAEMWDDALTINLAAPLRIDDALLARRLLRDGGRIVCLGSVSGIAGNAGQTNYAASKAGLGAYVRRRAGELAARGITVNAVAPGFIETRLTAAMPRMIREAGRRLSALGQGGVPGDVAEVITFLASPGAAGITGAVLRVCGGAFVGA